MAGSSASLDYWRKLFHSSNCDIFEVIDRAILVAAADCPEEFRSRRGRIAERLFTCRLSRCFGCNRVELQVPDDGEGSEEHLNGSVKRVAEKDSKVDSSNSDPEDYNRGRGSNYRYDEAEALTHEMEEESQIVGEVMRIKKVLCNHQGEESDSVLFESLRSLQLMQLSVETLKGTEIGRAVNGLRKHSSKPTRNIARTLIDGWKKMVDEWVNSTAAMADNSPESMNPSVLDEEEGLPSPPLDEGALLATTTIQLSEFFDEMDDDGNLRTSPEFDKKPTLLEDGALKRSKKTAAPQPKPRLVHKTNSPSSEQKPNNQFRKPSTDLKEKIELTKRKLHERYQEAENAKKQRTVQVMELRDLPKQQQNLQPSNTKPRNQVRNWANARR